METCKVVPGHHYAIPDGLLGRALLLTLTLCIPMLVASVGRAACLLEYQPWSENTLHVGALVLSHCIY